MAVFYDVRLRPDQFQHLQSILLQEAQELMDLTDRYDSFTDEQKEIFDDTRQGISELLEIFTPEDPERHEELLNRDGYSSMKRFDPPKED